MNRKERKEKTKESLRSSRARRLIKGVNVIMANNIEMVAKDIVDAAFKVHKEFGPGLLESAYQQCHAYELRKRGRKVLTELVLPLVYDGEKIDAGYRIDMTLMI